MPGPRSKSRAQRAAKVSPPVQSEAESLSSLVELLRPLSTKETEGAASVEPPPTKRARTDARPEAISIARYEFSLAPRRAAASYDKAEFSRSNVGQLLDLKLRSPVTGNAAHFLHIMPRGKRAPRFAIAYAMRKDDLPPKLVAALHVAASEASDEPGCLWAAVDVHVRLDGFLVELKFALEIRWNESHFVAGASRSRSQQLLRHEVLDNWFPELHLQRRTPESLSPQDFYQATCVPDKETFDAEVFSMTVPNLTAKLYPFQRRAVQWLLNREGASWSSQGVVASSKSARSAELPISFAEVKDVTGASYHLSPLFGTVARDSSRYATLQNLRGGILAEEMGLGKTLEIIALILLNRRLDMPPVTLDPYTDRELHTTSASLIVTPATLLDQWLSELSNHAPHLKVMYYSGLKKLAKDKSDERTLVERMAGQDVVVTTYEVLRNELHTALDPPDRSMRNAQGQVDRPKSPLVQLYWWRVCIDEAQMVENWTSNAAVLARLIPRVNAWGITGTPVKDDITKDLRGLLTFLRLEPYASDSQIWTLMMTRSKESFRRLFNLISMRHTKGLVKNEIAIPPQKRHVITMPFTAVEEQHYQSLFQELTTACGLDIEGNPLRDDWDPNDPGVQEAMRMSLDRLRQTALHPELGPRNRRALGHRSAPMRTVAEVLNAMLEQSENMLRTDQRNVLLMKLTRGQVLAGMKRVDEALKLWQEVLEASDAMVKLHRSKLQDVLEEARKEQHNEGKQPQEAGSRGHDEEESVNARVGEARRRVRLSLEVQHRAVFFCANAFFSIKSNEEVTKPDSEDFHRLEKIETEMYARAKEIRKEILQESSAKAKELMAKVRDAATRQDFAVLPGSRTINQKGIESRRAIDALEDLYGRLDDQAAQLDDWREHVIQLLLKPLVDEEDEEITGEEYEESTKIQEEIHVYAHVLRAACADRQSALSGQELNHLVKFETNAAIQLAKNGEGPFPEKLLQLFRVRDAIKPPFIKDSPFCSMRGVITELRNLAMKLKRDSATGNSRSATELAIVENQMRLTQAQLSVQTKAATLVEQEIEGLFMDTLNARMDFYRQLQAVSDMVKEYDGESNETVLGSIIEQEAALVAKMATGEAKHRYLLHLKEADSSSDEQRMCVICQLPFTIGVLTICGHTFCKACITLWFKSRHNCPICKKHLTHNNLHDITLKPQELKVLSDSSHGGSGSKDHPHSSPSSPLSPSSKANTAIYTEFNPESLASIKNIDLQGPNFTTKVDTLIRHLLWLRESDPGAKSIVFSQYKEFLDVLALAFRRYRIGYTSFDKAHGVANFKEDPGTEVFLLHARAHASGLNLVNASHVFLCEPLLNTALELQAIARVDRIGQEQETTVWLYIVEGTVEQSIYNLSVKRRMEHLGRSLKDKKKNNNKKRDKGKGKSEDLVDTSFEAANSIELQQAHLSKLMGKDAIAGEAIDKRDLWTCLFGHVAANAAAAASSQQARRDERTIRNEPAIRGFLAAEAAEERMRRAAATPAAEAEAEIVE